MSTVACPPDYQLVSPGVCVPVGTTGSLGTIYAILVIAGLLFLGWWWSK